MHDTVMEVMKAVQKLDNNPNPQLIEPGGFRCVQTALFQLLNDPGYESNLKDVLTAAIAFHLRYTTTIPPTKDDQ